MTFRSIKMISILLATCLSTSVLAEKHYGGQSMVAPLKTVLVKRPDISYQVSDPQKWHYTAIPNVLIAQQEHDNFVKILTDHDVEVVYHDDYLASLADSIYVHDPAIITDEGAIILRMGKELRLGEEDAIEKKLHRLGIPTFYKLQPPATAEGGDTLWLDEKTLAVGRSFRTNQAAIDQLTVALAPIGVSVMSVPLPFDQGKEACLHLQSLISFVDNDVAVVYKKLLPVAFVEALQERNIKMVDVSDEEYATMGPNILAIAPKKVVTIQGNDKLKADLEQLGIEVFTYKGDEVSLRAEGGATCLTRPLLRSVG